MRCVEYCLAKASAEDAPGAQNAPDPVLEEEWARNVITSLGFHVETATNALEACDFSFSKALLLLLYGNDKARMKYLGTSRFRSHTVRKTKYLDCAKVAGNSVREQYVRRAQEEFQ